jgi:hypothetical protein
MNFGFRTGYHIARFFVWTIYSHASCLHSSRVSPSHASAMALLKHFHGTLPSLDVPLRFPQLEKGDKAQRRQYNREATVHCTYPHLQSSVAECIRWTVISVRVLVLSTLFPIPNTQRMVVYTAPLVHRMPAVYAFATGVRMRIFPTPL